MSEHSRHPNILASTSPGLLEIELSSSLEPALKMREKVRGDGAKRQDRDSERHPVTPEGWAVGSHGGPSFLSGLLFPRRN